MIQITTKLLVVTDLDATLLDDAYSWAEAAPAIARLKAVGAPLVLNSSKTVREMQALVQELDILSPIIAENGGLLAVPTKTSSSEATEATYQIELTGLSRETILKAAHGLRDTQGYSFQGFADWTAQQVCERTGLSQARALDAQTRFATEPILWEDTESRFAEFATALAASGIRILRGGRFLHLMGQADKAHGAAAALKYYQKAQPDVDWVLVALGDSANDCAMLEAADIAVVIPHADGARVEPKGTRVIEAPFPASSGWNAAILTLLDEYC